MELSSNNLVHAVEELTRRGYDHNFYFSNDMLFNETTNSEVMSGDYYVDAVYRFAPNAESDDCSNLFVISTRSDTVSGLLVDAFDLFREKTNHSSFENFDIPETVAVFENDDDLPMKYGMNKILKADFNLDTDRYVLRKGFPDFPKCPFGQSFSMLGYDRLNEQYVWLVTKILRDKRLVEEVFEGAA